MKSELNQYPIDWLLEEDNPSVRCFTLTDLLGRSNRDHEVREAKAKIMRTGMVPQLLAKQKKGGFWSKPEEFYLLSKYKGTIWTFNLLAELGADGNDKQIRKTFEYILEYSQDRQSGGFSYAGSKKSGGYHSQVIPCHRRTKTVPIPTVGRTKIIGLNGTKVS